MNKQSITFKADEQELIKTGGINSYASNIVAYIEATFELGENWTGYDSVRAVWSNDYLTDISTVLDPNGRCIVPTEVLTDTGNVTVNLVGSISVDDELTDRLTTYPCKALTVDEDAKVEGDETESITPSQFEQFVSIVHDEVEEVTGMSAEASTLPAGSDATASYSDGVLSLGIPKGADGVDGKDGKDGVTPDIDIGTVETLETGVPAYANITGTVENPSLNLGLPKGNTGDTGATGAPAGFGAVTATIDGTTGTPSVDVTASGADTAKNFAFAFHNLKGEQGEQGEQGDPGVVQDVTVNGTTVVDQNGVAVIKVPELVKTVQGNPIVLDDAFGEVKKLDVELLPIQDLHGYDKPWAGGAGKNKFLSHAESMTRNGVTFTANADGTVTANGTATADIIYEISEKDPTSPNAYYTHLDTMGIKADTSYRLNGAPSGGGGAWRLQLLVYGSGIEPYDTGELGGSSAFTFTQSDIDTKWHRFAIRVTNGTQLSNVVFKPMIYLASEADNTYAPYSNICPITGHDSVTATDTGKNLLNPSGRKNSGSNIWFGAELANGQPDGSFILKAGTYTLSASETMSGLYIVDSNSTFATKYNSDFMTFTTTEDKAVKVLYYLNNSTQAHIETIKVQLEHGGTKTDIADYHGQSKTVTLPHTVYGAGVGVTSGEGKEKWAIVDLGSLTWTAPANGYPYFYSSRLDDAKGAPVSAVIDNAICSSYPQGKYTDIAVQSPQASGFTIANSTKYVYLYDPALVGKTVAEVKTALSGVQLCYETDPYTDLSTTPTDLTLYSGDNVISSDGDMELSYVQDMAIVIEKLENLL